MQASWPGTTSSNHEEESLLKEHKAPKTLADRFTAVFNKKGKGGLGKDGGQGSGSSTPKFSDRWIIQLLPELVII